MGHDKAGHGAVFGAADDAAVPQRDLSGRRVHTQQLFQGAGAGDRVRVRIIVHQNQDVVLFVEEFDNLLNSLLRRAPPPAAIVVRQGEHGVRFFFHRPSDCPLN